MIAANPLISIIVPVYLVEPYLKKCVDSILRQSYSHLEVILVDDGSPDLCGKICDEYAALDQRIHVIHKENGGLSSARNAGLDHASGEYITFIDSDDAVDSTYIAYLYHIMQKYNVPISCCGHRIVYPTKAVEKHCTAERAFSREEALNCILYDKEIDLSSWGKLYKASLFKTLRFPESILFEDTATTYLLFDQCERIAAGPSALYDYTIRSNSITTNTFSPKKMDLIYETQKMVNYISAKYPALSAACSRRLMWAYLSTYVKIMYTNPNEYQQEKQTLLCYIFKHRKAILADVNISKRDRIALILIGFRKTAFHLSWNLYAFLSERN